jgi:hypothetical protein
MAQIGIGIFAVGVVAVAFVLSLRCPAEKIPEPARWLGAGSNDDSRGDH